MEDCKNEELYIYRSKTTERRKAALTQGCQGHTNDTFEETESFNTLNCTSESALSETAEIGEQDRLSRYTDHDRIRAKKCYRCGADKHVIRDGTFGLKI